MIKWIIDNIAEIGNMIKMWIVLKLRLREVLKNHADGLIIYKKVMLDLDNRLKKLEKKHG